MVPRAWLAGLSLVAAASAASAETSSIPVRLELSGPPGCSSMREMLDALQRRHGRVRLATPGEDAVTLQMRLSVTDSGLRGALSLRLADGSSSERAVDGATCQAVVEALSLTAALALASVAPPVESSAANERTVASPSSATPRSTSTKRAGKPAPGASSPGAKSAPRIRLEAGAQASLGQMVAPHLNVGGGLLGRARLERSSVVSPSITLSLTHTRNELFERSQQAELRLTGLSLAACPMALLLHRRVRFEPCVSATAAELSASGRDLLEARSVSRSWWGAGALGRFSLLPVPHLAIELEGGGLVPLVSRRFVSEPSRKSLGETPAVAPFASVGVVYAL